MIELQDVKLDSKPKKSLSSQVMEGGSDLGHGLLDQPKGPKRRILPQRDDEEGRQNNSPNNYQDLEDEDGESTTMGSTDELDSKRKKNPK
jgi:hypothetical protein